MFSEICSLILAVLGILFILFSVVYRLMIWQTEDFKILLTLNSADKEIYNQIINLRELLEFCGIHKKCTIVLLNYGAPNWFCDELRQCFSDYNFLKIIDSGEFVTELRT